MGAVPRDGKSRESIVAQTGNFVNTLHEKSPPKRRKREKNPSRAAHSPFFKAKIGRNSQNIGANADFSKKLQKTYCIFRAFLLQ